MLCNFKVTKLDVCTRPLFANPVTNMELVIPTYLFLIAIHPNALRCTQIHINTCILATIVIECPKPKVHHGQPQGQRTPVEMLQ